MNTLAIDIETYSSADLIKVGAYAYADAPDFEILLIAYSINGEPVEVIDLTDIEDSEEYLDLIYPEFHEALYSTDYIKTAYNANFERTCLTKYFDKPCPPEQWRCTAVLAATVGLPPDLAGVGEALGLGEDDTKQKTGTALIDYFCKPCKPTKTNGQRRRNLPSHAPEKWELFIEYNRQDVVAEMAIKERLNIYQPIEKEQRLWTLDQQINDRGIYVDIKFANGIVEYDTAHRVELMKESREITRLKNPNSLPQLKKWFFDQYGMEIKSLSKETIPALIKQMKEHNAADGVRVLEIRQEAGKTSTAKYVAMQNSICSDGKIRGTLQFYGANRSGRWAGRIVQVHNLPQNKIPDIELARELVADKDFETVEMLFGPTPFVFSQLIRTALVASPGNRFVVSDFSAIEARVIAWLAGEQWRLDVFNSHGKIYEASASQMFKVPIENIKKGSSLRQKGKVAELALGYQGSAPALIRMGALDMGLEEKELYPLVHKWREANPCIVKLWYKVETAAKTAMQERRTVRMPLGLEFSYINRILFIKLPSGRKLAYYNAKLEPNDKGGEQITYEGVQQETKKWGRLETYGGKLVENIVQATARDCLAEAMLQIDQAEYDIAFTVHDEIICDVPIEDTEAPEKITQIMGQSIDWAPGLPLRGDTYETRFYKKD
ncbi:MAG: DNA polymerase [Lachnospiraceae bacterium]